MRHRQTFRQRSRELCQIKHYCRNTNTPKLFCFRPSRTRHSSGGRAPDALSRRNSASSNKMTQRDNAIFIWPVVCSFMAFPITALKRFWEVTGTLSAMFYGKSFFLKFRCKRIHFLDLSLKFETWQFSEYPLFNCWTPQSSQMWSLR